MAGQRKPRATSRKGEVFSIRLDPKLKFAAEIAARTNQRSLGNYIEYCLKTTIDRELLLDSNCSAENLEVFLNKVWSADPAIRFLKLVRNHPAWLSNDEVEMFRVIEQTPYFWLGYWASEGDSKNYSFIRDILNLDHLIDDRVIEYFDTLQGIVWKTESLEDFHSTVGDWNTSRITTQQISTDIVPYEPLNA